jgi:hypothetical protein
MNRQTLCRIAIGLGVTNYLVYAASTVIAGGDVLHGHVAQGHFFAASGNGFVEVSRTMFEFCRWHAYSLLVTFPLVLWGGFHLSPEPHEPDAFALSQGD